MFFQKDNAIKKLSLHLGADYGDVENQPVLKRSFETQLQDFKKRTLARAKVFPNVVKMVADVYGTSATSDEVVSKMYDAEYGQIDEPHYMYLNSLLSKSGFEYVTGYSSTQARPLKIIDIGAGSDELLRFCHEGLGVPNDQLYGSDVSTASKNIIERDGFHGYVGRIESLSLPKNTFDLLFLSYFIDYDTDQHATFASSVELCRPGGKIILEGLFPCRPFGLLESDKDTFNFVTKGISASEDISLVCSSFQDTALQQGRKILVEKIIRGQRFVYSHYGLRKLSSFFIVMKVEK